MGGEPIPTGRRGSALTALGPLQPRHVIHHGLRPPVLQGRCPLSRHCHDSLQEASVAAVLCSCPLLPGTPNPRLSAGGAPRAMDRLSPTFPSPQRVWWCHASNQADLNSMLGVGSDL